MNKYQYYVNGNPVSRNEMMVELKNKCYKIVHTEYIGDIGIDTTETDEKKFNSYMRKIEQGHIVLMGNKTFRRKKI
ncbi:MAG: hypothetical protein PUE12_18610 [Oscillospiraceae bacterium]|nr:hypothetical protein [Oscillospiraceae bacterium]